jgi:putative CRISPR-associated protein (TIGR02619 family)
MNVHIVTCGTSIIENYSRHPNIPSEDSRIIMVDDEVLKRASPKHEFFIRVYEFLKANPYNASAELKAMKRFLEDKLVDEVYLYHTDTGKGLFCARIIEKFLTDVHRLRVETIRVEGFGVEGFFEDGLINLLDKIIDKTIRLVKAGNNVFLNATGGFKPENAILTTAASLLGIQNIYYIHEKFREHVNLPILPLAIDQKYLKPLQELYNNHKKHGFTPLKTFTEQYSVNILQNLKDRNLVIEENGKIKLRKWTYTILKYILEQNQPQHK